LIILRLLAWLLLCLSPLLLSLASGRSHRALMRGLMPPDRAR
jgi:hypothetical protein